MDRTENSDLDQLFGQAIGHGDTHSRDTLVAICSESSPLLEAVRHMALARLRAGQAHPTEIRRVAEILVELERLHRREHSRALAHHKEQFSGLSTVLRRLSITSLNELPYVVTDGLCGALGFRKSVYSPATVQGWCPTTIAIHSDLGDSFKPLRQAIATLSLPPGMAPREEEVMRTGRAIAVGPEDVYRNTYRPLVELSNPCGYLAVPVISSGRVTGLLHVDQHTREPDDTDMKRVQMVAKLCALSADRSRLRHAISQENRIVLDELVAFRCVLDELEHTDLTLQDALESAPMSTRVGEDARHGACGHLSDREHEVFELLAAGMTTAAIGERLFVSANSVKSHVQQIYRKLDISSRAEAAALFRRTHRHDQVTLDRGRIR